MLFRGITWCLSVVKVRYPFNFTCIIYIIRSITHKGLSVASEFDVNVFVRSPAWVFAQPTVGYFDGARFAVLALTVNLVWRREFARCAPGPRKDSTACVSLLTTVPVFWEMDFLDRVCTPETQILSFTCSVCSVCSVVCRVHLLKKRMVKIIEIDTELSSTKLSLKKNWKWFLLIFLFFAKIKIADQILHSRFQY